MMPAKKKEGPQLRLVKPDDPKQRKRPMLRFGAMHRAVLLSLAESDGLTDEELTIRADLSPSHARGRRNELVRFGMVEDTGTTRTTSLGRKAAVWRLTPKGRQQAKKLRGADRG